MKKIVFLVGIMLLLMSCATMRGGIERQVGIHLHSNQEIPNGYKTYTLFLSASYDYSKSNFNNEVIPRFESGFDSFSKSIGEANLASIPYNIRGGLDIQRSKDLLDLIHKRYPNLSLSYNDGPYVIVLNHHPKAPFVEGQAAVAMSFNGFSGPRVIEALNYIEQGVRREQVFDNNLGFYEAWLDARTMIEAIDWKFVANFVIKVIEAKG